MLSPILFSIYVDNILANLSEYGCKINGVSFGSFMYADDLILLAASASELQIMINVCSTELAKINLKLNTNKCMRIGERCFAKCSELKTKNGSIYWVNTIRYLGLTIIRGKKFKVSFEEAKGKFYSAFNALYSKFGNVPDVSITLHLLETVAIPTLIYAIEALALNKSELKKLGFHS